MRRRLTALFVAAGLLGSLAACSPGASTGATPVPTPSPAVQSSTPSAVVASPSTETFALTVFAAASLRDALEALVARYAEVEPAVTITVSTGASSALRAQIEEGAPADVFLSADTKQPAALVQAGLSAGEAKVIAGNRLAIVVPTANPASIATPADLARAGVKIIAAGDAVPITGYATTLIANLAALDGYPPGFAEAYAANVVSREDDVKAVVAKIELGEGDAAIVYETDAQASEAVTSVPIPSEANVAARYAGVLIGASPNLEAGRGFLDWLNGSDAQAILATFGFSPPTS
jgi:molybdate transport system substrate-binding protein